MRKGQSRRALDCGVNDFRVRTDLSDHAPVVCRISVSKWLWSKRPPPRAPPAINVVGLGESASSLRAEAEEWSKGYVYCEGDNSVNGPVTSEAIKENMAKITEMLMKVGVKFS